MSILIKGMEMPSNCFLCPLSVLSDNRLFCELTSDEVVRAKIDKDCPLIEVDSGEEEITEAIEQLKRKIHIDISPHLLAKALSVEWQKEHKALGFHSPLADVYEMLEGEDNGGDT